MFSNTIMFVLTMTASYLLNNYSLAFCKTGKKTSDFNY